MATTTLLRRDTNQALGLATYAIQFMRNGNPSKDVLARTALFFADANACGASALAHRTNAPTLLRREDALPVRARCR